MAGNYIKKYIKEYIKEKHIKQINDTREWQKKTVEKGHVWKESGFTTQERREVEVCNLLLDNDKNDVIAGNFLAVDIFGK